MSDQPPWVYRGAFIPFPVPVPVPGVDPLSTQDVGLCWADAWTPAILGALKALTRPETWVGSQADIEQAMLGAEILIGRLTDGCGGGTDFPYLCEGMFEDSDQPYSFATISVDSGCGTYSSGQGYLYTDCGPFGVHNYRQVALIITFDNPQHLQSIDLVFDLTKGNFTVPGSFDQVYITDLTHSNVLAAITLGDLVDGTGQSLSWTGDTTGVGAIEVVVTSDEYDTGSASGFCNIRGVSIGGVGPSPC